jgi:hypothetical protein
MKLGGHIALIENKINVYRILAENINTPLLEQNAC